MYNNTDDEEDEKTSDPFIVDDRVYDAIRKIFE
jgi:hypothetical protein